MDVWQQRALSEVGSSLNRDLSRRQCLFVNMTKTVRKGGKFTKQSQINWLNNVANSNKIRSKQEVEKEEEEVVEGGRHVVERVELGKGLWCSGRDDSLSLRYFEGEIKYGLASVWRVRCHRCLALYEIQTGQLFAEKDLSHHKYVMNLKCAIGE